MNTYPIDVQYQRPERSSRWLALATLLLMLPKALILLPHLFILYVLGMVAFVCGVAAQVAVLFTGKYPKGLFDLLVGVMRWQVRVNAYLIGLTDQYPPFQLNP